MNSIYELNKLMRAMQVVVKPVWFDKDIFQLRGALDMISYPPAGLFSLEILWELKKKNILKFMGKSFCIMSHQFPIFLFT